MIFKRMCDFLVTVLISGFLYSTCMDDQVLAQNPTCPTRPAGDSSNACASTAFVSTAVNSVNLVIGLTPISGGTNKGLLYDNNGLLGNLATLNFGVLTTSSTGVPSITNSITLPTEGSGGAYRLLDPGGTGRNVLVSGATATSANSTRLRSISPSGAGAVTIERGSDGAAIASFLDNGQVGIGTTSPISGSFLDVQGNSLNHAVTNPTMAIPVFGFEPNSDLTGLSSVVTITSAGSAAGTVAINGQIDNQKGGVTIGIQGVSKDSIGTETYGVVGILAINHTGGGGSPLASYIRSSSQAFVPNPALYSGTNGLVVVNEAGKPATVANAAFGIYVSSVCAPNSAVSFLCPDGGALNDNTFVVGQNILNSRDEMLRFGSNAGNGYLAPLLIAAYNPDNSFAYSLSKTAQVISINSAAPSSPAAGYVTYWTDSTALRFHDKNSAGTIGTTAVAKAAVSNNFLTSMGVDGTFTAAAVSASGITGGAALTKTDDTNVTLTLGGTPTSALLQATSITVGWTGTLANARLATMATNTIKGNATSGTASPTDLAIGSCSTAASALNWTTNTGFGCNTSITANAVAVGGITGLGTGVATWLATPSSANLAAAVTDETGSGALVFGTAPTIAGGTHTAITSLGIRDTSAAFDVTLAATSTSAALTAGRTLTLDMGNVAHTLKFGTTANTITFPNVASDTVALLGSAQTLSNVNTFSNATASTSAATGAVVISTGGLGVGGALFAGGSITATNTLSVIGASPVLQVIDTGTGTSSFNFFASSSTQQYQFGNQTGAFFLYDVVNARYVIRMNSTANTLEFASTGATAINTNIGASGSANTIAGTLNITAASDAATTDNTLCISGTGRVLKGSGTLGICLGTSGRQFKTDFTPMTSGLDDLMKINFQNYRYRDGFGDNGVSLQYGTTAQDVEMARPDLVRYNAIGEAINYDSGALLFIGLHAIQQVNQRLTELENRK